MKAFISTLLVTSSIASAAIAGNVNVPEIATLPVAAATTDAWGGLYAGGMYSMQSGNWDSFDEGVSDGNWEASGNLIGGFAGYNIQRNALVFGGEIAYSAGDTDYKALQIGSDGSTHSTFTDLKARVGYALNNVLVYGVAGATWGTDQYQSFPAIEMSGINYGAGVQMKVGGNIFVGVEYLVRDLEGDLDLNPDGTFEYQNQTISLRAGWQF